MFLWLGILAEPEGCNVGGLAIVVDGDSAISEDGTVNGLALGVPLTGVDRLRGVCLGGGIAAETALYGVALAPLGLDSGERLRGIAVGGLGAGAGTHVQDLIVGGWAQRLGKMPTAFSSGGSGWGPAQVRTASSSEGLAP